VTHSKEAKALIISLKAKTIIPKGKPSSITRNSLTKKKPMKKNLAEDLHHLKKELHHLKKDLHHLKKDLHHLKKDLRHLKKDLRHLRKDLRHLRKDLRHLRKTNIRAETLISPQIALKSLITINSLTQMILKKINLVEDLRHLKKDLRHLIRTNIRAETLISHQIALKNLTVIGMISIRKEIFSQTNHMSNLASHKTTKRKSSIDPTQADLSTVIRRVTIKRFLIIVVMREAIKEIVHRFKKRSSKEEVSKMIMEFLEKIKLEIANKVLNNIKT
jgi:chromosome segregation ATPase